MHLYRNKKWTDLAKHSIWMLLVFLAFSFDVLFSSVGGLLIFLGACAMHFGIDVLRVKNQNQWLVEGLSLSLFLVYALALSFPFAASYVSPYFALYLTGMVCVSVIPTQLFRMLGVVDRNATESEGISERLALFIFLLAGQYWFALIATVAAFLYRSFMPGLKPTKLWWLSPLLGWTLPFLFKWFIFGF